MNGLDFTLSNFPPKGESANGSLPGFGLQLERVLQPLDAFAAFG